MRDNGRCGSETVAPNVLFRAWRWQQLAYTTREVPHMSLLSRRHIGLRFRRQQPIYTLIFPKILPSNYYLPSPLTFVYLSSACFTTTISMPTITAFQRFLSFILTPIPFAEPLPSRTPSSLARSTQVHSHRPSLPLWSMSRASRNSCRHRHIRKRPLLYPVSLS
jgi:hypothetical protein